jgi:hypothetical protein
MLILRRIRVPNSLMYDVARYTAPTQAGSQAGGKDIKSAETKTTHLERLEYRFCSDVIWVAAIVPLFWIIILPIILSHSISKPIPEWQIVFADQPIPHSIHRTIRSPTMHNNTPQKSHNKKKFYSFWLS